MHTFRAVRTLVFAVLISVVPVASFAGVFLSVTIAPPPLPVYAQPACPGDGYMWTPGYWAYGPVGYYWVPGVWVMPPQVGLLWTPGYWGFAGGVYGWHGGYWGRSVGFYGGVNYGFGYPGRGFIGGRWQGNRFAYNTAITHVNRTYVHNTYEDRTVIRNTTVINRTSFNGPGGVNARASRQEMSTGRDQRFQPTSQQMSHERMASSNRGNFASANRGRPATPAMSRPAENNFNRGQNRVERTNARPMNQQREARPASRQNGGEHRGGGGGHERR